MFEDFGQHLKNEAHVVGGVLAESPKAMWDEISRDWSQDKSGLLSKQAVALGVGAVTGVLLSRCPLLGRAAIALPAAYFGLEVTSGVGSVLGSAWNANTLEERQALISSASGRVGREAATAVETMPAFLAGGGAGMFAGRRVPSLDRLSFGVLEAAEFPLRQKLPEGFFWRGKGTEMLPLSLKTEQGAGLNVTKLSEMLAERHPWQGVEEMRALRLSDMKLSRTMKGTPLSNEPGFADKAGQVLFHTHPPRLPVQGEYVIGARPSIGDLERTVDFGIIQSGQYTTIYRGLARDLLNSKVTGTAFEPRLQAVVLDRKNGLAVELEQAFDLAKGEYVGAVPRTMKYGELVKTLSNWDGNWSKLAGVASDHQAALRPAILELFKVGL